MRFFFSFFNYEVNFIWFYIKIICCAFIFHCFRSMLHLSSDCYSISFGRWSGQVTDESCFGFLEFLECKLSYFVVNFREMSFSFYIRSSILKSIPFHSDIEALCDIFFFLIWNLTFLTYLQNKVDLVLFHSSPCE